ncbi:MAG: right-handed parallel beta-helix repeat-containing protein [Planctomycetes bacterium]|nr:right-handed parallel beta-helix repeat-containing protein [Planctomycetota bacterium]
MLRMLDRCLAPILLAAAAHAGGATIYGDPTGTVYPTIQAAIDAAPEGAVIVTGKAPFAGFVIDGKSVALATVDEVYGSTILGTITIRNLGASQRVLIDNYHVYSQTLAEPAVSIENCAGDVRIQASWLQGFESTTPGADGGNGLELVAANRVTLVDGYVFGGEGQDLCSGQGGNGGHGVVCVQSRLALYDMHVNPGGGGQGSVGGDGGDGGVSTASLCIAYDSHLSSAGGGDGCGAAPNFGGDGGNGWTKDAVSELRVQKTSIGAGTGGQGVPLGNQGTPGVSCTGAFTSSWVGVGATFRPDHRALELAGAPIPGVLQSSAGAAIYLPYTSTPAFLPPAIGFLFRHLPVSTKLSVVPAFTLPLGSAHVQLPTPQVAPGEKARVFQLQPYAMVASSGVGWGEPRQFLLLENSAGADCNGNGLADVFDVLQGTSEDLNGDTVPDECHTPTIYYVDAAAAPGGNGSLAAPFQTLFEGFAVATTGDTILVEDGVYTGAANRGLVFNGRAMTVKSRFGPDQCVIDCQGAERAFRFHDAETEAARVEGFTIRNGLSPIGSNVPGGGGIAISSASPTIANCVFELCSVGDETNHHGAAIGTFGPSGSPRIEGCTIRNCDSGGAAVGLASQSIAKPTVVLATTFEGNVSAASNVPLHVDNAASTDVVHCRFLGNQSASASAIEFETNGIARLRVEGSLFAGNQSAPAILAFTSGAPSYAFNCELDECTFVDNPYGALEIGGATHARFANSIAWDPSGPGAAALRMTHANAVLEIAGCDLQSGVSGVQWSAGTLQWGAANIAGNPLFVDLDGPDNVLSTWGDNVYRLQASSPCLDAGANTYAPQDWADVDGDGNTGETVPLDLNGKPRFKDLPYAPDTGIGSPPLIDIGCYERQG